jgi:radical SAM superfamily enzyme YgiQ (UPF0313 family)
VRIALVKVHETANRLKLSATQYPVNLGYLASVCLQAGWEVELWDFCVEPFSKNHVLDKLRRFKPHIVGLSCVTAAIRYGHAIASWVKQFEPEILTVLGGVHLTALPVETMTDYPDFDIGVLAEGEDTLAEILARFEAGKSLLGIVGTACRHDGAIRVLPPAAFPDVNTIPFPNRALLPHRLYDVSHASRGISRKFWKVVEIDSSRGCPFNCTFCNADITHGRRVRFRTPENVLAEIHQCVRTYGSDYVVFNDSTFTLDRRRIGELVRGLPKIGIKGYMVTGHVKTVDYEVLKLLKDTGCTCITFGVESGSQRVLDAINKHTTIAEVKQAFAAARRAGIPQVEGTFILGADLDETKEEIEATARLMKQLKPDTVGLGIITPFPGTAQYREMKQLGYLEGVAWDDFQIFSEKPPPWRTVHFTGRQLVRLRNEILKSFYWNPAYIGRRILKLHSLRELAYYLEMAAAFFRVVVRGSPK